jgi:hypothetical protein
MQMTKSMKAMMMSAAVTGLLSGSTLAMHAATTSATVSAAGHAVLGTVATSGAVDKDKHSCKGKNSCKGQGGCKAGDNGCKGKNSCKGKGGCATDGSKPPQA